MSDWMNNHSYKTARAADLDSPPSAILVPAVQVTYDALKCNEDGIRHLEALYARGHHEGVLAAVKACGRPPRIEIEPDINGMLFGKPRALVVDHISI